MNTQINKISIGKSGSITLIFQFAILIFGIISSIILARGLGPNARGSFALMVLVTMIFTRLGSFGLEISNVYYTANQNHKIRDLVANSIVIGIVSGFLGIFLVVILSEIPLVKAYFEKNNVIIFMLYAILATLPVSLVSTLLVGILQGQEKIFEFNSVSLIISFIQVVFQLGLIFWLDLGIWGAVCAYGLSAVSGLVFALIFIINTNHISIKPSLTVFRESTTYASKAYTANLLQFLNYRLDQFMVGFFLGPAQLGFYVVAVGIVERLWMIPQSIAAVLFPRTSADGSEKANILTPKVTRFTLLLLLIFSLGVGLVSRPFVILFFGETFEPSIKPLLWLLPGVVALGYGKVLMSDLAGRGRPDIGLIASGVSFIVTLVLDLLLIPRFKLVGAAAASSIAYVITTIVILMFFSNISKVMFSQLFLPNSADFNYYRSVITKTLGIFGAKK
jgi:O-antigen/teichoic acid export membrane protein